MQFWESVAGFAEWPPSTQASKGKQTVVVIAHRLSTVRNAQQIVVMDKGRVSEVCNHPVLLFPQPAPPPSCSFAAMRCAALCLALRMYLPPPPPPLFSKSLPSPWI